MMPAQSRPPKHLMTLLASLMLNRRLQQRPPISMAPPVPTADGNRMAELARMQLGLGRPRPPMM